MATDTPRRPMTRVERRRQESVDEAVAISRDLLRSGEEITMRVVAQGMGLSATALYRYFEGIEDLLGAVAGDIYVNAVQAMAAASSKYPDDPPGQLAASATAFREWALANRADFRLVFASNISHNGATPPPLVADEPPPGPAGEGLRGFSDHFAAIFINLCAGDHIKVPEADELDESMQYLVEHSTRDRERELVAALGLAGPGTLWLLKLAWARLYGAVLLEVFHLVDHALVESSALFYTLMRENFDSLGMADSWDRLEAISRGVTTAH